MHLLRNPRVGNKLPALFVKKLLCMGNLLPMRKIFIERPVHNFMDCFYRGFYTRLYNTANSPLQKYENKRIERLNVLVFENSFSV